MKRGRNDPCPCGSGRKYKKCCLVEADTVRLRLVEEQAAAVEQEESRGELFDTLGRYAVGADLEPQLEVVLDDFAPEPLADDELVADAELKFLLYAFFDLELEDGGTVAGRCIEAEGARWHERKRALLVRLAGARLRLYEVEEVRRDEGFQLFDLRSGSSVWVREKLGTHEVVKWDILAARISPAEDGVFEMEGGSYLFHPPQKAALLAELRHLERLLRRRQKALDDDGLFRLFAPVVHRFWLDLFDAPRPTVVTAEGDSLLFGKLLFDVLDEPALRDALAAHPAYRDANEGWVWIEDPRAEVPRILGGLSVAEGRLMLEVWSRQRAETGRALLEATADAAIRHRATRFEGLESAMKRSRGRAKGRRERSTSPEEAELLRDLKHQHYATWADVALPALDGRTPRHAARLKTQRARVVALLKTMENAEARLPAGQAYDFGWIWSELGLERT